MGPDPLLRLRAVRGFVLDLDGTLVLSDRRTQSMRPLPGAVALTSWLSERGVPYRVFTNGTAWTPQRYVHELRDAGFVDLPDDGVLTPASSAADLFVRRGYRRVLALGTGLAEPLREAGMVVVEPSGWPRADAVLIGLHRAFTMDQLEAACHAVWSGAAVYSSSQAAFYATAGGRALGTSRAIAAMISSVTGCGVRLVGKPSRYAMRTAADRLGVPSHLVAVVGDDPELEVPMAHVGRALAVAVGTGLARPEMFSGRPANRRPHLMVSGVDELLKLCMEVVS